MAKIKLELEDTADGGMSVKIEGDDLATAKTIRTNSPVQNLAISLIEHLREFGIGGSSLPDLR